MVGYNFVSPDKNAQFYGHGGNFNMADIERIFERRVFWFTTN